MRVASISGVLIGLRFLFCGSFVSVIFIIDCLLNMGQVERISVRLSMPRPKAAPRAVTVTSSILCPYQYYIDFSLFSDDHELARH